MFSSWRDKRRSIMVLIFVVFVILYIFYQSYSNIFPQSNCFDGIKNNNERGIDCGGSCQLICPFDISPLHIKFAKAVETEKDLYDLVALIQNNNQNQNSTDGKINYSFIIYDKTGQIFNTINGSTTILLGQDFPIILQNIVLPLSKSGNSISRVQFKILDDKVWDKIDSSFSNVFFRTFDYDFENGQGNGVYITQLSTQIENLTRNYFRNIPVRVIVYNRLGNVIAVNESLVDEIFGEEIKEVVFTWRNVFSQTPDKIDFYPIVTPSTYFR